MRVSSRLLSVWIAVVFTFCVGGRTWADVIHVPGTQLTIQGAINVAQPGDEIVVAVGTYFENIDLLGKAVTVRSTEPSDPRVTAATVIDAAGSGRVVTCATGEGPDTVLDGLTFANGLAGGGGGMACWDSSPTVIRCTFRGNVSTIHGGGMDNGRNAHPTVIDCTFIGNSARVFGGGIFNYETSSPTITGCIFMHNVAESGGGISNGSGGRPIVRNCVFMSNVAEFGGGGMLNEQDGIAVVTECTFITNNGRIGAGMANFAGAPIVTECLFIGNTAGSSGGGMINSHEARSNVINCMFIANTVYGGDGGAMVNSTHSKPILTGCLFSGNQARFGRGGAIWNFASSPVLTNCTFSGNFAHETGAMLNERGSRPVVSNTIFYDRTLPEIENITGSKAILRYCNVQGGYEGVGNIEVDPMFVDVDGPDDVLGTEDDDLRLLPGSPCVDAADNTRVPADGADIDGDGNTTEPLPLDLDRHARFVDDPATKDTGNPLGVPAVVDMGSYEYRAADADRDGDTDLLDFAGLAGCLRGPGDGGPGGDLPDACTVFDLNADDHVDLLDVAILQIAFTGSP